MKKLIGVLLVSLFSVAALADFVVIANSGISAGSISKSDLKSVFSANMSSFGGSKVQVVMLPGTDPTAAAFFSSIGLSAAEFDRIWLEKALSGQANPPSKKSSSADVISAVGSTAGGIGVIPKADEGKVSGGAKVLTVN